MVIHHRGVGIFQRLIMGSIVMIVRLSFRHRTKDCLHGQILSMLSPNFQVIFFFPFVVWQRSVVFRRRVGYFHVRLILMLFVLVNNLINSNPSHLLTMTFMPPAIRRKRIRCTIRRDLLAKDSKDLHGANKDVRPSIGPEGGVPYRIRIVVLGRSSFARRFEATKCLRGLLSRPLPNDII